MTTSTAPRAVSPLLLGVDGDATGRLSHPKPEGLLVVSFRDGTLRILTDCSLVGRYGFVSHAPELSSAVLETAAELSANVASSPGRAPGVPIGIAILSAGDWRTTRVQAEPDELHGGCKDATHFVAGVSIGTKITRSPPSVAAADGREDWRTRPEKLLSESIAAGGHASCQHWTLEAASPPEDCAEPLRVDLLPIQDPLNATPLPDSPVDTCPAGYVRAADICTPHTSLPHACRDDREECDRECLRGNAESCYRLALILKRTSLRTDSQVEVVLEKACDLGDWGGCDATIIQLALHSEEAPNNLARATQLAESGCNAGKAGPCYRRAELLHDPRFRMLDVRAAERYYRRACNAGSGLACAKVATLYVDLEQRYAEESELLQQACRGDFYQACERLGTLTISKQYGVVNVPVALEAFNRACKNGGVAACADEGIIRSTPEEGPVDLKRAFELFSRACEHDVALGCARLGAQLLAGIGVERNPQAADRILTKGCKLGELLACVNLGTALATGHHLPKDARRGEALLKSACDSLVDTACFNLGALYEEAKKYPVAADLYDKRCKAGAQGGCVRLARLMEDGRGRPRNVAGAERLYGRACDDGEGSGCYFLAVRKLAARSTPEALHLLDRGCALSEGSACSLLGEQHATGHGTTKDLAKAVDWYGKACDLQSAEGCENLGWASARGDGTPPDMKRAQQFFQRACDSGSARACGHVGFILMSDPEQSPDPQVITELFQISCTAGNTADCGTLGARIARGLGATPSVAAGTELMRQGCAAASVASCVFLELFGKK